MEINIIPKFIDDAASAPAKAIGNTITDIWNLTIGSHFSHWSKKQDLLKQKNLDDFIKRIEESTQEIPIDCLKEPELHIIGPVIEASKYYIDSETLRQMFANLISASIDERVSTITHPSFVEIIKQLSPMDAEILVNFKRVSQLPIAEIRKTSINTNEYYTIQEHIANFNDQSQYQVQASSLTNLGRLGILSLSYAVQSLSPNVYEFANLHPAYTKAVDELTDSQYVIDFAKGLCTITPLGRDFIKICL